MITSHYYSHSQPLAVLVFAFVGIVWACYPLLTIPVYSGDAKIWVQSDTEDTVVSGDCLLLLCYSDPHTTRCIGQTKVARETALGIHPADHHEGSRPPVH